MKATEMIRAVMLGALTFAVVACTSTPKEKLNTPVGALNADSKYALIWIKPCQTKFLGGCDRDDGRTTEAKLAIHGAPERVDLKELYESDVALSASIARIDATQVIENQFLRKVKQDLSARQLNVVAVAAPIHAGALRITASDNVIFDDVAAIGATQFPLQVKANTFELSSLYERLDVDYLVVMELLRFSIDRHYGPTGKPVANPQAVSAVRLYLHQRATGEILFDDFAYNVVVSGDSWDKPPHYQLLTDSLKQTLQVAIDEAGANLLRR